MRKEVIGNCELYLGDCLDIMPTLDEVDHVICDPPYEDFLHENNKRLAKGRALKDKRNPFESWDFNSINSIRGDLLDKINCSGWFIGFCVIEGVKPWVDAIGESRIKYKRTSLWIKPDGMPQFNGACAGLGYECFITAWCGAGQSKWNGGGKHGVYYCNKGDGRYGGHPTEKPVRLMSDIIRDYSNQGETILDPFMGSGTTGVACVKLGRKFIGIEMNKKYFDLSCRRIEQAYNQPDMFIEQPVKVKQESLI